MDDWRFEATVLPLGAADPGAARSFGSSIAAAGPPRLR